MGEPTVLGAILRVDVCGWDEAPPRMPADPVRVEVERRSGVSSFFYDLLAHRTCVSVADASQRVGAVIEALAERWPLANLAFPARCRLDLGLFVGEPSGCWRCDFPAALLSALADAEIELGLSFYPLDPNV